MWEGIILGTIQGIAEWLPVSSSGLIVLVKVNFFGGTDLESVIQGTLLLHLGTFLAALVYLRQDVWRLLKTVFHYKQAEIEDQRTLRFVIITTIISGVLGILLLQAVVGLTDDITQFGKVVTGAVALLLFITAWLQIKAQDGGAKKEVDLRDCDSYWLGIAQGLAALPGLSRSGLTVATLLLRKYDKSSALRLSFLLSLPIVLGGNILLNFREASFSSESLWGLLFSFIFGLITIDLLMKVARKINFGYFVLFFAVLTLAAVFI